MIGIRIADWTKRNTARLSHCRKVRLGRGLDPMAPLVLDGYASSSSRSREFEAFAAAIGLRNAQAFWHRVNCYCASKSAQTGEIHVQRSEFGGCVLTEPGDPIGRAHGEKVYDALLSSGLAVALGDGTAARSVTAQTQRRDGTNGHPVPSRDARRDGTNWRAVPTHAAIGDGTRPTPVPTQNAVCDGTSADAVTAQEPASRALAHDVHTQGASPARDLRARLAHESSSLERASCADTGAGPRPDQTRKAATADVPSSSDRTATAEPQKAVWMEEGEAAAVRLRNEIIGISIEPRDPRRASAKQLLRTPAERRNEDWCRAARAMLALGAGSAA